MLVLSTQLCELVPPNLLFGSRPHPTLPSQSQRTVYTDSVWLEGAGGVELCWRPCSAGVELSFLTRFRTYKIAELPQTKT